MEPSLAYSKSSSSEPVEQVVLDFRKAMAQFQVMFPNLNATQIEVILRKHKGDVSATVDDLLQITSISPAPTTSTLPIPPPEVEPSFLSYPISSSALPPPPSYSSVVAGTTSEIGENHRPPSLDGSASPHSSYPFSAALPGTSHNHHPVSNTQTHEQTPPEQPNCADDEKIALLLQNREFLGYLQRDPQFMRELNQRDERPHHQRHTEAHCSHCDHHQRNQHCCSGTSQCYPARSHHYCSPIVHPLVLPRRYYRYDTYTVHAPPPAHYQPQLNYLAALEFKESAQKEKAPRVPDGPRVDFSKNSVPNGPLVDYADGSSASWTQKLKSHLPSVHGKPSAGGSSQAAPSSSTDTLPPDSDEFEREERLREEIWNSSKNSKSLLLSLAKKFSLAKKNNDLAKPTNVGEQNNEIRPPLT